MKKHYWMLALVLGILLPLALAPLGGYLGFNVLFAAAMIGYAAAMWYLVNKHRAPKQQVVAATLLLLPAAVLFLPLHIFDFDGTLLSLPCTLAHFVGAGFGAAAFYSNRSIRYSLLVVLLLASGWGAARGYDLWSHKLNFGTYSGRISEPLPRVMLHDENGQPITTADFQDKVVVLDFWTTSCGICFRKFPMMQAVHEQYQNNRKVEVYAVNVPLTRDTAGQAEQVMKKLPYTFGKLYMPSKEMAELFGVTAYPTVLVLQKGKIIYRGDSDGLPAFLSSRL